VKVGLKPEDFYKKCFQAGYDYSDIPVLFEMDGVECGDIVKYDGEVYSICSTSPEHNFSLAYPIDFDPDCDKEITNDNRIKCPVCGDENHDSWECGSEDENYQCTRCGSTLSYTSETTRTFYITMKKVAKIKHYKAPEGAE